MKALRIELEGITTSFRFPHLLVGRQPSFPLPPPATIYGHLCSAVGEPVEPRGLRFAYSFSTDGRVDDLEHQHILGVASGKLQGYPALPRNLEGSIQPGLRELLFCPRMTLYFDAPERLEVLAAAFREPRYAVVLGRSQDLAAYRSVEIVELVQGAGYAEGTLLPLSYLPTALTAQHFMMPRRVDPEDRRRVFWEPYLALLDRAEPPPEIGEVWIDERTQLRSNRHRAVVWHSFADEDE